EGRALTHRSRLGPCAALAVRRGAAHRPGQEDPRDHRRLAEVQGPTRYRGDAEDGGPQGEQEGDLRRRGQGDPGGRRRRPEGQGQVRRGPGRRAVREGRQGFGRGGEDRQNSQGEGGGGGGGRQSERRRGHGEEARAE